MKTKMKNRIKESCSVHESRNRIKKKYQNYGKNRNKKLKLKKEFINNNKRWNRIFQALKTRENKWILRPK